MCVCVRAREGGGCCVRLRCLVWASCEEARRGEAADVEPLGKVAVLVGIDLRNDHLVSGDAQTNQSVVR